MRQDHRIQQARVHQQHNNVKAWAHAPRAARQPVDDRLMAQLSAAAISTDAEPAAGFTAQRPSRRTQLLALTTAALLLSGAQAAVADEVDPRTRLRPATRLPLRRSDRWMPATPSAPRRQLQQQPVDAPSPALEPDGPLEVAAPATYNLGWGTNPSVVPGEMYQTQGTVYRPLSLGVGHPMAVLVHGYHWMCENENVGCPSFLTQSPDCMPVPSYRGYDYIGQHLASQGVVTVSIDMNSIDCYPSTTNLQGSVTDQPWARGRLVLQTLALFKQWSVLNGAPASLNLPPEGFVNHLDLSRVALMGHSRGGEGVRAAYALWNIQAQPWAAQLNNVILRGVFELAPTDGQADKLINATGIAWAVMIPTCDGDVSDLEGVYPYDRAIQAANPTDTSSKSMLTVWGADHNKANTVWAPTPDDTLGCAGPGDATLTGTQERNIVAEAVGTFMRGTLLGGNSSFFNPVFALPQTLANLTHVDRSYSVGPAPTLTQHQHGDVVTAGNATAQAGLLQTLSGATDCPHRNVSATRLQWGPQLAGNDQALFYLSTDHSARNVAQAATIDFRMARFGTPDVNNNPPENTNLGLFLVDATGNASNRVALTDWAQVGGPVGRKFGPNPDNANYHVLLQSVRIPLANFTGVDQRRIVALRTAFDATATGDIAVADLTLSMQQSR